MIDINTIDWSELKLAKVGRSIQLLYNKKPFQFCTSPLYTPFGVKSVTKEWSAFDEFSIDCSLNQAQTEGAVRFRDFITQLDTKIQELVKENASLFNSNSGNPGAGFVYNTILRENGTYPKLMKLQLPRDKNGNFTSFVFDEQKNKIPINESNISDTLTRGKVFRCIIECSKIWSFGGKVGSIWNIVQLKFSDVKIVNSANNNVNPGVYNTLMISD